MFINKAGILVCSWQAFERAISRLLICEGFSGVRVVGQTGDRGADIIAHKNSKRWLFQAKHWKNKVGVSVIDETLRAMSEYRAQIPVIVASHGFDSNVKEHQQVLHARNIPLQLWDASTLVERAQRLSDIIPNKRDPRPYQDEAIKEVVQAYLDKFNNKALIVMATGLGKTFVAAESIRRINSINKVKTLVLAHTNDLVYQLERVFWHFITPAQDTVVWNGYERPAAVQLEKASYIFACVNTVADYIAKGNQLPYFDVILVDECHHVGASMYKRVFDETLAGKENGAFSLGVTATPWRPDEVDLKEYFGEPRVKIDIIMGLKKGFLSNVDYRMYTDNINWDSLKNINGNSFTPKQINKTLFINQWDDAVITELRNTWAEQPEPRAIVFCGTIDHAVTMRDRINSLGFCNASAIYSQTNEGLGLTQFERNRILSDFSDGLIDVICAVDVFNEGIDVPDVNILVFQRVTHSRRIFIQQLGRGLRIAEGKDKVIVLDFVSDIRRFAAGIDLKDNLECDGTPNKGIKRIDLPSKVTFRKVGGEDKETEAFLREWLNDVIAIENAGEGASVLKFPPALPGGKH